MWEALKIQAAEGQYEDNPHPQLRNLLQAEDTRRMEWANALYVNRKRNKMVGNIAWHVHMQKDFVQCVA